MTMTREMALRLEAEAERDQLRAEVERLQRAAVPGNGPEMLRMQTALKRSEAEVERLKADNQFLRDCEETAIGEHDRLNNAANAWNAECCKEVRARRALETQLRELREAVQSVVDDKEAFHEHIKAALRAVLAKVSK